MVAAQHSLELDRDKANPPMPILSDAGVSEVRHFAPLHYLVFIARSQALLSKPSLKVKGFEQSHLRSKSHRQDQARGFGEYAFLTLDQTARIACAKLAAGFPHISIAVPAASVDDVEYSLCRFNVAMTRYLRRNGKPGPAESDSNGRYYAGHQIPIARTPADRAALLAAHYGTGTMIEVLIHGDLPLPPATIIECFSRPDADIARDILAQLDVNWSVVESKAPGPYQRRNSYVASVSEFISTALADPAWRGNGLEFDRV